MIEYDFSFKNSKNLPFCFVERNRTYKFREGNLVFFLGSGVIDLCYRWESLNQNQNEKLIGSKLRLISLPKRHPKPKSQKMKLTSNLI